MQGEQKTGAIWDHLSLRLRIFLFFCLIGLGSLAILGLAAFVSLSQVDPDHPGGALISAGVIAGFLILGLTLFVWRLFDENVARPIERVAADIRARAHGGVAEPITDKSARYLGDLAPSMSAVTGALNEARTSMQAAIARETSLLSAQAEKLTALVSDVPVGLIICGPGHQMVFYNAPARALLADSGQLRLDRCLFDLLREGPIRRTYARLLASDEDGRGADLLLSTTGCGKSLSAHMRLVRDGMGEMSRATPGYVLTLRDVTADLARHRDRERLLSDIIDGIRRPATELRALLARPHPDIDDILHQSSSLAEDIQAMTEAYDCQWRSWWPMQDVRAADLIDGLRGQLAGGGPALEAMPAAILLRCDGVTLIDLLAALARGLQNAGLSDLLSLGITLRDQGAELRLAWQGRPMLMDRLETLLEQPLNAGPDTLTGREVLTHHGASVWCEQDNQGGAWLTVPLPEARAFSEPASGSFVPERRAVFDFDLLNSSDHTDIHDMALSKLTYVVFDTETTGLNPNGGDEIVQLAAVRVVNGRIVPGETLDELIDPERTIPPGATAVHGITNQMIKGAPTIRKVGARFHRFSDRAVLVAHNAPFDMAFFHRHAETIGARFDNPVLDTVLLSAVLFGQHQDHTLDALAARFGVTIPDEHRHTAMGDTAATAEVFLRMVPMLEAKGLHTFGQVLTAMEQNSRLMKEMTARVAG